MTTAITNINGLYNDVKSLYNQIEVNLPFHGWEHVNFVYTFSQIVAEELGANAIKVQLAALTHDLNYLEPILNKSKSALQKELFILHGFSTELQIEIEDLIKEASIKTRTNKISVEAMAISDADTLYKALPITPILFATQYMKEQNVTILELAKYIHTF